MQKIILTTSNLTASLNRSEPAYYVIEEVVTFMKRSQFPAGSVLDFRGGSFESITTNPLYVSLNGSTVYAPAYCIFYNVDVSGFGNSYIRSEWFKAERTPEHEAINRSLEAADGIPVHLEGRTYELTGSIVFPDLTPNTDRNQTLVCPGVLQISKDIPAIIVDKTYVNLDINKIQYSSGKFPPGRAGIGIKLTGNAYYLDISVNTLENLDKAIAVIPDLGSTKQPWSGIQYCTIRFKNIINAEYCFYVDLFNNGNPATPSDELPASKWFSEARVIGGKMSGVNGIYFERPYTKDKDKPEDTDKDKPYAGYSASINGLLFENITFEHLTGTPIFLSHISSSKFLNLRFGSDLTESNDQSKKWIYLNYVSYLTISVQKPLEPNRILIDEEIYSVIFDAFVIDNYDSTDTPVCHFDRLAIMPLTEKKEVRLKDDKGHTIVEVRDVNVPLMTATSSIQPYNMANTIFSDYPPMMENTIKRLTIKNLLPLNSVTVTDDGKDYKSIFNVLPRTLNLIIKQDDSIEIDLTGLSKLAPCVIDVYAMIERRGSLVFKTSQFPSQIKVLEDGEVQTTTSATFNDLGIYRLTFDSEWNVVISKVTL